MSRQGGQHTFRQVVMLREFILVKANFSKIVAFKMHSPAKLHIKVVRIQI
jgi:hypothetical protein